jgi:hypothetical protein
MEIKPDTKLDVSALFKKISTPAKPEKPAKQAEKGTKSKGAH